MRRAPRPRKACPSAGGSGAGSGTAASKLAGRENAVASGVGYAAARGAAGVTIAAIAVANPFGDVLGEDGAPLAAAAGVPRTAEAIAAMAEPPDPFKLQPGNTTLVCLMTDLALSKAECARVARAAAAGLARAVEPVFTDVDGDVVFCLAAGSGQTADRFGVLQAQTVAARVAADAVRDAVLSCR